MSSQLLSSAGLHIGRVLLASLFVLGGVNKILNYSATAATMSDMGFPLVSVLLPATIALELGCGMAVAVGRWGAVPSALILFVYTILVNFIFHRFWTLSGDIAKIELSLFFKNISIAGAMLYLAAQNGQRRMPDQSTTA